MNLSASHPICGPPRLMLFACVVILALAVSPAFSQWVEFDDQTDIRVNADGGRFATDTDEKDYAWGDVDRDGDLDLAIARKQPFTSSGKRVNVLLMNINGVLTDRTSDFAVASDVPGDLGFNTPTNDRDVIMADLNNDNWLDMVTTTAISDGDPRHIGYPRIYMNLGCSVGGGTTANSCSTNDWNGFRYELNRIPEMLSDSGQAGFNPCFCSVSAGDVTGDGFKDLYFVDYDTSCGGAGSPQDFNDKLLINKGALAPGFFQDVTESNFIAGATGFPESAFGASSGIAKFNEDNRNDILKQFAGSVDLAFNSSTMGMFDEQSGPYGGGAYFVNYGDLNNDNKLDLVVSDDGQDRYLLNQGDGADDVADFISFAFGYSHGGPGGPSSDDGFGGNSIVADLDKDGWRDVIVTDADVDVGGCTRRTHIYRNLGGAVGGSVTMQELTGGTGCETFLGNPATCLVASIPSDKLEGTHDVAVFDINGDTYLDLVVGRCSGTEIYVSLPDIVPGGGIPDGDSIPGTMLTVDKDGSAIQLSWGESCMDTDTDYSIYEGSLSAGDFTNHAPRACSTGGATTQTLSTGIGPESSYFLVGPRNEEFAGSLGEATGGSPRHAGTAPCAPQVLGNCGN